MHTLYKDAIINLAMPGSKTEPGIVLHIALPAFTVSRSDVVVLFHARPYSLVEVEGGI